MGTFAGTDRNSRLRSRSAPGTAGFSTIQAFNAEIRALLGSSQRQTSAWPSAKLKVQPLLWRVAGKLIHVHNDVPNSHHRSGALIPKALCWMLFSCSSMKTMALAGAGL